MLAKIAMIKHYMVLTKWGIVVVKAEYNKTLWQLGNCIVTIEDSKVYLSTEITKD